MLQWGECFIARVTFYLKWPFIVEHWPRFVYHLSKLQKVQILVNIIEFNEYCTITFTDTYTIYKEISKKAKLNKDNEII